MFVKPMMMILVLIIFILGIIFAVQGASMHNKVFVRDAELQELQLDYWNNSKAVRDAAESNSELTGQLAEIKNFPSELLTLKLVGIGRILTGIFVLLFGIMLALVMMPSRLGKVIKKSQN